MVCSLKRELTGVGFGNGDAEGMRGPRCGWFYGRLFEIAPAVKPLLRGDMTEQDCKSDGDAGLCGQQSGQSRSRVAGGERSCQATRRLWWEGSLLHVRSAALLWTLEQGLGLR